MPISLLVPLIAQVGIPVTQQLIAVWEAKGSVTSAQFAALIGSAQISAKQVLENQLTTAGIALTDPHAVALLALV
jgi:hypothetical protein